MSAEKPVYFTQYLRPDGRTRAVHVLRPSNIAEMAASLTEKGCRFDLEELMPGLVSMTVERDDDEGETVTLAIALVASGPGVEDAVDGLVLAAADRAEATS